LFYLLFVGEHSPEQDKSAGSGFERCEATARRVAGRTPAIYARFSNGYGFINFPTSMRSPYQKSLLKRLNNRSHAN
ncbi:TPA: hypothetical protein ACQ717_001569, partial [Escherichia coli]